MQQHSEDGKRKLRNYENTRTRRTELVELRTMNSSNENKSWLGYVMLGKVKLEFDEFLIQRVCNLTSLVRQVRSSTTPDSTSSHSIPI